jgi:endonuclease/exonuclease/phosphatase family metal-dependent hydrolase
MNKASLLLILLASVFLPGCKGKNGSRNISVMTFNIHYDDPHDNINAWPARVGIVCELLKVEKPDLFGLQEALWYQYEAIDSALAGYSSVAVGPDDGRLKGEMNPLFYSTYRFDYVRDSTFWLSETPDRPGSKSWGAPFPGIVTWVELTDKKTHKPVFCFNTRFSGDSENARIMSAGLLLNVIKRIAGKNRFVVIGDFNTTPESKAYSILTRSSSSRVLLKDSYNISEKKPGGPVNTFNGWSDEPGRNRIDYIFVRRGIKVLNDSTFIKKAGSVFISDHWPVKAVISLK